MAERPEDEFEQARLILNRRRQLGEPFEVAWARMLDAIPAAERNGQPLSHAERERNSAINALRAAEGEWQAAYDRRPRLPRPCPQRPPESALSQPRKAVPVDEAALIAAGLLSRARAGRQAA